MMAGVGRLKEVIGGKRGMDGVVDCGYIGF